MLRLIVGAAAFAAVLNPSPAHGLDPDVDWQWIADVLDWLELEHGDGVPGVIDNYFTTEAAYARSVADCESRFDPLATGAAAERGIFQLHPVHRGGIVTDAGYDWADMYDPVANIRTAKLLRDRDGWGPWTCAR